MLGNGLRDLFDPPRCAATKLSNCGKERDHEPMATLL
jgi:hypothetical protein